MKLTSSAFSDGSPIPAKYTCEGSDLSPPLAWSGAPPGTKSFALICDDPDAPGKTFVHWVLYNVPAQLSLIPENQYGGGLQGKTDFGRVGYGGPCPPPGKPHRYFFKLYALDDRLSLQPGASKADLERAMRGHALAEAKLMGTYDRTR